MDKINVSDFTRDVFIKIDGPDQMFHPSPNPRTIAHVARTRTRPPPPVPRTTRLPRATAAALDPPDARDSPAVASSARGARATRPTRATPWRRRSTHPTRATPRRRRSTRPTRATPRRRRPRHAAPAPPARRVRRPGAGAPAARRARRPGGGRGTRRRRSTRPTPRRRRRSTRPRPGGGGRPTRPPPDAPAVDSARAPADSTDAPLHPASPAIRLPDARPGHRRSTAVPSPAPRPPGTAAPGSPQRRRAAAAGSEDVQHKREEMNRKKREYRARKKAEANDPKLLTVGGSQPSTTPLLTSENVMLRTARTTSNISVNPTTPTTAPLAEQRKRERRAEINEEQRQERNRKQREYRARKKAEAYNLNYQNVANCRTPTQSSKVELTQPSGGSCSTIVQQSVYRGDCSMIEQMEKENIDPDDPTEWLHRNDDYVRRCQPNNYNGGSATTYITPGAVQVRKKKLLINRDRYINMEDSKKAKYLRDKQENMRESRKRKAGDILTTVGTPEPADGPHGVVTQEEMMCEPLVQHRNPGEGYSDKEFDSELYEPTHLSRGIEVAHGEAIETCNFENHADEETRHYLGDQGDEFESYRVPVPEVDAATTDDPYDFVYQNLPKKHHVLRKGKIKIHIPDVPDELKRLFTSQEDDDAKYFRKHIRYFNSHFSFTSLGVTLDKRVSNAAGTGIYTFRVHGGLYHRLDHLVPGSQGPRHLQLYFYDTEDDTLSHRVRRSPDLDINLIRSILIILQDNPYVQTFTRVGSIPNLDDYRIELNTNVTPNQRRYNAPTASQVAAIWLEGNDPQRSFDRSMIVYAKGDRPHYIRAYHGCYDPLAYPLFFPRGETGWNKFMPYNQLESETPTISGNLELREAEEATCDDRTDYNETENHSDNEDGDDMHGGNFLSSMVEAAQSVRYVSAREYYCFRLQARKQLFNILLFGGRLFQQWAVDMYIKIESMRLDWYSNPKHQKLIRAELYQGVVDVISAGETRASEVGKRIMLPRTFPWADRDMQQRFLNAMALVQRFGKPDYFITMTCNPYWEEITSNLEPRQTPQDRPDLVARVYRAKLRDMKDLLIKERYFGEVAAYAHVTEFQKRGLPHEHFLLIMKSGSKLTTPDDYDKVISAEIPDKEKYHVLHKLVIKHMLHGPCGALNRNCPCMVDGKDSYP
ncbi:hypothetical protein ACP4OV_007353 [Aristida adscensionis]